MSTITFKITLDEPLLIAAPGKDPNTSYSQDFIPGSTLRGALASQYIQNQPADDKFKRLFLDGTTRFAHAYPAHGDTQTNSYQRTQPTPLHWVQEKDGANLVPTIYNSLSLPEHIVVSKKIKKPFVHIVDKQYVHLYEPQHIVAVHNARHRGKGRAIRNDSRSALFRYHALAAGQIFIGQIHCQAEDEEVLRQLLSGTLLLGGSRTAGYGRTQITTIPSPATPAPITIKAGQPFTLYLLSDTILHDPRTGQTNNNITAALPIIADDHSYEIERAFCRNGWVGGFNDKWELPLPQVWALQKGSVWQLTSSHELPPTFCQHIQDMGLGARRAAGFGEVALVAEWPSSLVIVPPLSKKSQNRQELFATVNITSPIYEEEDDKLLQQINERLARHELDQKVTATVQDWAQRKQFRIKLSNSQLARIRLLLRQEQGNYDAKMADFIGYLDGIALRKSARDQFRKSKLRKEPFQDWLHKLASKPERVWNELVGMETAKASLFVGPHEVALSAELAHEYTIRLIDAVCEHVNKKGKMI